MITLNHESGSQNHISICTYSSGIYNQALLVYWRTSNPAPFFCKRYSSLLIKRPAKFREDFSYIPLRCCEISFSRVCCLELLIPGRDSDFPCVVLMTVDQVIIATYVNRVPYSGPTVGKLSG